MRTEIILDIRVEKTFSGIYYVSGGTPFKTQLVVTKQLKGHGHSALKVLSKDAKEEDIRNFIETTDGLKDPGDIENVNAVMQVSVTANREKYDLVRKEALNMCEALMELLADEVEAKVKTQVEERVREREKKVNEQIEEKVKEVAQSMYQHNTSIKDIAIILKKPEKTIEEWLGLE